MMGLKIHIHIDGGNHSRVSPETGLSFSISIVTQNGGLETLWHAKRLGNLPWNIIGLVGGGQAFSTFSLV